MPVKYNTTVTTVGELAAEFVSAGILIFFGPDAPEELWEAAIITETAELEADIIRGDVISIGGVDHPVLSVGPVANDNLRNLGHLVIKFNGLDESELPGDVSLPVGPAPVINPGTRIVIEGN